MRFFALRTCAVAVLAGCLLVSVLPHVTQAQATGGSKQLQRVRGTVGYATVADAGDFKQVFAKLELPDDDYAVTRGGSAAVLAMPDSSLISLGENTSVKVGAFDSASASPGSTITVNGGALRFDIKRPVGGAANYRFLTPTSQIAVRGTVGLLAFTNSVTTVGCVVCAADSVTVTTATQTVTLVTGQFVAVSAAGAITTGALSTVTAAFSTAGVPVTSAVGPAAAGVPATGAGAGAAAGAVVPIAAGAAAAAAIGIAVSQPSPAPSATIGLSPNATPSGSVTLTGTTRAPAATTRPPVAAPPPPPPVAAPPGGNFPNGRYGR